jgi:hypothetical protein
MSKQYRPDMPEVPDRIRALPVQNGYPVPWFLEEPHHGPAGRNLHLGNQILQTNEALPPGGGVLFDLGPPLEVLWFCKGRPATRAEVLDAIDAGYPALMELAKLDGPSAIAELEGKKAIALTLIPKEPE